MRPPDPTPSSTDVPNSSLLGRYARRFGLVSSGAEARLFYECVPLGKRIPVRLHRWLRPNLYGSDLRLVHEAGQAMGRQEVLDAIDRWHHRASRIQAWEREAFGWRISGRLLLAVSRSLFQAAERAAVTDPKLAKPAPNHGDSGHRQPSNSIPARRQPESAVSRWIELQG